MRKQELRLKRGLAKARLVELKHSHRSAALALGYSGLHFHFCMSGRRESLTLLNKILFELGPRTEIPRNSPYRKGVAA